MGDTAFVILFALLFVFSVYIGFTIGEHWGERAVDARAYWLYNLVAILICVVLTAVLTLLPCSMPRRSACSWARLWALRWAWRVGGALASARPVL